MIEKFTCIIVDDEPYAIELLKERLQIFNKNVEVINTYSSWEDALEGLREHECDILLLDISLHEKNGMELLNFVPNIKSEVIFVTAHSEFAINAFRLSVSGYILKPINDAELVHAIDKAIESIQIKRLARSIAQAPISNKIAIPQQKSVIYVDANDIIYLEAVNVYTKIILKNEELICSYNMGRCKSLLPIQMFYQVHRSFVINLNYIARYENSGILTMSNNKEIPVSKNIREDFLKLSSKVARK